ncbi:MAG: SseB family protein [Oscillospiraceae bacterium]
MANENQNRPVIENPELVEAIAEMRKDFKAETQNKVINLALKSSFLVPALINKNTQLVADADNHVKFEEKPQAKFLLITHKEKGTFFPVFTDVEELSKFKTEQDFQGFAMRFGDIAALTEKTPNVKGFVINPMNQNLPFTKDMLESIKQTILRVKEERAKAAAQQEGEKSAPDITVSTNPANE